MGHHEPYNDDENPSCVQWFHSINSTNQIDPAVVLYPLDFLSQWRRLCDNKNVYRTLKLLNNSQGTISGPFLIDIDNSTYNLDDALKATREVITFVEREWSLDQSDIRIFFSGRKGFNLEIRPQALGISGTIDQQETSFSSKRGEIISHFPDFPSKDSINQITNGNTVIDIIHQYIRLHNSLNEWIDESGNSKARRKIELSHNDFERLTVNEICSMAEKQ